MALEVFGIKKKCVDSNSFEIRLGIAWILYYTYAPPMCPKLLGNCAPEICYGPKALLAIRTQRVTNSGLFTSLQCEGSLPPGCRSECEISLCFCFPKDPDSYFLEAATPVKVSVWKLFWSRSTSLQW